VAEDPRVQEAKEKLRDLVVPAVQQLEGLLQSEHDGVRLGAAKEVLDRGGVPTKQEQHVSIEVGLDDEIEQLIVKVRQQLESKDKKGEYEDADIEDAELVEDAQLPPGEQAAAFIGVPIDEREPTVEETTEVPDVEAWWQATPD
jgi:hypothetical protein